MVDGRMDRPARAGRASARLERLRAGRAWGSLLSAREFTALASAGFDPVGQVLGIAVVRLRGAGRRRGQCRGPGAQRTLFAPAGETRQLALSRAVAECAALGGDGITGVTVRVRPCPAGGTEFTVQGTAVRARTAIRPAAPFASHVPGPELASLLQAGWVPAALVLGVSVGTRHGLRGPLTGGNGEIRSYTALVNDTRSDARARLTRTAMRQAADGVVTGEMTLRIMERECQTYDGHRDYIAEVTMLGTSIVAFTRSASAADRPPLTVMRLNPASRVPGGAAVTGTTPPATRHGT